MPAMPLHRAMAASAVLMALLTSVGLTDPEFGSVWHDGKAELDGYRLTMLRYGQPRAGQAVMVYVTEPFRERARVKADDPSRDPADVFDVLSSISSAISRPGSTTTTPWCRCSCAATRSRPSRCRSRAP